MLRAAFVTALLLVATRGSAQPSHYAVTLRPDFARQIVDGREEISVVHARGRLVFHKDPALDLARVDAGSAPVEIGESTVVVIFGAPGRDVIRLSYTAHATRGLRFAQDSFFTAFYCQAWMVCDPAPGQRATLSLEIIVPPALRAAGPGVLGRQWSAVDGEHFRFDVERPVQTYLFSAAAAPLRVASDGRFTILAAAANRFPRPIDETRRAFQFVRGRAGTDPLERPYTQAFVPGDVEKEAAASALLPELVESHRDRPLHWDGWRDVREALGPVPYTKGALFQARVYE